MAQVDACLAQQHGSGEDNNRIKQLIEINDRLSESLSKLQKSNRLEEPSIFCGSIAHSMKNEFLHMGTSIKEIKELGESSSDIQEECDYLSRSLQYSQMLLNRLLEYFEIGEPIQQSVALYPLIKEISSLVDPRLPSSISLSFEFSGKIDSSGDIKVDSNREILMGVLLELINNARKALASKGGNIKVKIKENENYTLIAVKDDGPGMSPEIRRHIFDRQIKAENGLGVGLMLSRKMIQKLHGDLEILPSEVGMSFLIKLPRAFS